MATHNRFFSFFSAVEFVVVVAFAPFLQQGGELFFFSEKLLSFLPLFFRGVLYTQKVTIYPIYTNRLRNARGYIFIRNACVPLKQNKFS